ncbi:MAG: nucleoside triphosphate pyrophosphohydrolase [Acidobacteriota bacterium]
MASFDELVALMTRLRGPGGCPWDREQTLETLKIYLVEETYEVLDAIDAQEPAAHAEELGDLLMQVVFQAEVRREEQTFDIGDVITAIHDKLVRRHPHVFGSSTASTAEEVLDQWERLKAREKRDTDRPSLLDHVPPHLPALLRASRLTEKAARVGFDWTAEADLFAKVEEEWAELRDAVSEGPVRMAEELGDLLFVLANVARRHGIDPEEALRQATRKFERRFRHIEQRLSEQGRTVEESDLAEMDGYWDEAKRIERTADGRSGST